MNTPGKKAAKYLFPAAGVLLLLIFLTAGARIVRFVMNRAGGAFFYPYLTLARRSSAKLHDHALLTLDRTELARRVEELTARNRELVIRGTAAAGLLEENRMLRRKLKLAPPPQWKFVTAEILLRDPLRFRQNFVIDRGERDGIAPGDAVVDSTSDGRLLLIGIIGSCGARSAGVVTILDPELHISGRLSSNGAVGFLNTGIFSVKSDEVRFGMLPVREDYVAGEAVVTTGYERHIPEGIKIGELLPMQEGFRAGNSGVLELNGTLRPAADFSLLRVVTVISRKKEVLK